MCRNGLSSVVFVEIFICFVTDNFNIPSFCCIFVSRLVTSIETRNVRFFTFVFSVKGMISVILVVIWFCWIIKRKPNIHVLTRGWVMQFPILLYGWVSHFCAEERGWAMCFLLTTFPNAPVPPPRLYFLTSP